MYNSQPSQTAGPQERTKPDVLEGSSSTQPTFGVYQPGLLEGMAKPETTATVLRSRLRFGPSILPTSKKSNKVDYKSSIYFKPTPISPDLRRAVTLVQDGRALIKTALLSAKDGRRKDSDETVMEFKQLLPELFCLRTISEAFGAVINSIESAMFNLGPTPLTIEQLTGLEKILRDLLRAPAMTFDQAVDLVIEFEASGFDSNSPAVSGILDLVELMNSPAYEDLDDAK